MKNKKSLKLLKDIVKGSKTKSSLISLLDEFLVKENNKPTTRKKLVFHPSEISYPNACYRKIQYSFLEALGIEFKKSYPFRVNAKLARIFNNGSYMHDRFQTYFWKMNILEGRWECKLCGAEFYDTSPEECPECSCPLFLKYDEVVVEDPKNLIYGHADGILNGKKESVVLELKSMNEYRFKSLRAPLEEHKRQIMIYMYCIPMNKGYIIYENKNSQDIKSFKINYDKEIIEDILENIRKFRSSWFRGKLLPRLCAYETEGHSYECPYVTECFKSKARKEFKELMLTNKLW